MELKPINQRLKFLLQQLGVSARTFSEMIGEKSSNTQNYVGSRGSMPGADYLEKVLRHFESINPTWLLLGEGEPFKDGSSPAQNQTNISGNKNIVASGKGSKATLENSALTDCEKERDSYKSKFDNAQTEIQSLRDQLARADALITAKDEMLDLLRGGFNRPN